MASASTSSGAASGVCDLTFVTSVQIGESPFQFGGHDIASDTFGARTHPERPYLLGNPAALDPEQPPSIPTAGYSRARRAAAYWHRGCSGQQIPRLEHMEVRYLYPHHLYPHCSQGVASALRRQSHLVVDIVWVGRISRRHVPRGDDRTGTRCAHTFNITIGTNLT